jgi:hypothetical protein
MEGIYEPTWSAAPRIPTAAGIHGVSQKDILNSDLKAEAIRSANNLNRI